MRNKIIFSLVVTGVMAGLVSAYVYAVPKKPLPPAFNPAPNPYADGIYANGIIESLQSSGENMSIYPEVSGTVVKILVAEGERVQQGIPLFVIDDSIQRAAAEQQKSQAEASLALLQELRAQPRKENLHVAKAQVGLAATNLKSVQDQFDKLQRSHDLDARSVSKDTLDNAANAVRVASANLEVASNLFDGSSVSWAFGGSLTAPLFRGGTLWYQRKAAIDARNQSLALYRQTVLAAFAQVVDALRALEHDAETLDAETRALAAAQDALKLVQMNYESGIANYLQVLLADTQYLQAKVGYIQAEAQRLQDTTALFVALGGGWWNGEKPRAQPASKGK